MSKEINPFIYNEAYPQDDDKNPALEDLNTEEAYEAGVSAGMDAAKAYVEKDEVHE
jgi:predicted negative regulator of RcsB-dependent stress response